MMSHRSAFFLMLCHFLPIVIQVRVVSNLVSHQEYCGLILCMVGFFGHIFR